MKRALLALALTGAAFAPAAPALADHCGDTLQPPCETCVYVGEPYCLPYDLHLPPL
jgi:hypothetical protein